MGGILSNDFYKSKQEMELARQLAMDQECHHMTALQKQSIGRSFRSKPMEMTVICGRSGAGKSVFGKLDFTGRIVDLKNEEHTNIQNVEFDYIGELLVDTRNYDIDVPNMGVTIMDSSIISLSGSMSAELQYKEQLNSVDIVKMLKIDTLDECEVDIGIFRFVFGFSNTPEMLWIADQDIHEPILLSKHKYPYAEEEFLDKEYPVE